MDKTTAVKVGFGAAVLGVVAMAAPLLWALASAGVATFVIVIVGLAIAALVKSCIARNLTKLQEGNYEPGWNEIKSVDASVDWPNKFQSGAAAPSKKK